MAKRFSETDKWQDEWFSELKPFNKLIFLFLVDRCDNAGFFEINARLSSFLIGITIEQFEQGLAGLNKCLIKSNDGKKIWLKNFIQHQKNLPLNSTNNAHKQIIFLLNSNKDNFDFDFTNLGANEGLISPLGKGKGKGKGNGNGIVIDYKEEIEIFKNDKIWFENFGNAKHILPEALQKMIDDFLVDITLKEKFMDAKNLKEYFTNVFNKNKQNESHQRNNGKTKLGTSEARIERAKNWSLSGT